MKDEELEQRISELSKKYFQTQNPALKAQVANVLDMLRIEMQTRMAKKYQESNEDPEKDIDNLINIT